MEVNLYMMYAVFCFLTFFMSQSLIMQDTRYLKILSGVALIFLGLFGLQIDYVLSLSTTEYTYTFNSESWQIGLCGLFWAFGIFNVLFGLQELTQKTVETVQDGRFA